MAINYLRDYEIGVKLLWKILKIGVYDDIYSMPLQIEL